MLDEHGQPPEAINYKRNLAKATQSLLGLCQGLLADTVLTDDEINFLDAWLKDNELAATHWPGSVIAQRVRGVLADGVITEEERRDLLDTLSEMTGMDLDSGVVSGLANTSAAATPASLDFDGRAFCFTGKFVYGPRVRCQQVVVDLGGLIEKGVTKRLDYLVIGGLASRDWVNSSHGRKIEKAVQYRERGIGIEIVEEEAWVRALR